MKPPTAEQQTLATQVMKDALGITPGVRTLLSAPIYRSAPSSFAQYSLLQGSLLVLEEKFDAETTLIERDGLVSVGDMGYLDDEGFLFVCDRASDMVISGGVNIYPAEIEHVLITLPGVADCAVAGIPDEEFGESLAAQVVAEAGAKLDAESIRQALAERIAGYKVPRHIDIVDALPRDDNGKVQKRQIRDAYWSGRARKI